MGTYVSMLNWNGAPPPAPAEVRAAILRRDAVLRRRGLHSLMIVPDRGVCAAIMIATVADEWSAERLARAILPDAPVGVESMRFDDESADARVTGTGLELVRRDPRDYLESVLDAVIAC